ncbi:MAG TPA: SRPBCC domain-containing protein [Chitinophagaceae bacterium]|nr:SRPBCC domain-containing protein [Chitinophagaceae bacterium]
MILATKPLIKEVFINAPVERVWKALVTPEEMKHWYFDLPGFRAEPGYTFSFPGESEDGTRFIHHCRVTRAEAPHLLAYTWTYEGFRGTSEVTFELSAEGAGTRLRLTHAGLESFAGQHPGLDPKNFDAGWEDIVRRQLKAYAER